jgi:hypothetical protein
MSAAIVAPLAPVSFFSATAIGQGDREASRRREREVRSRLLEP